METVQEIALQIQDKWTEGSTTWIKIENLSDKWIFFKVKGTDEAVKLTTVVPNKGIITPKKSESVLFKVKSKELKKGDTDMKFLLKWSAKNLDGELGGFKNLPQLYRFSVVSR